MTDESSYKSRGLALEISLREIANRSGAPTMDYSPENAIREQRTSLDWIAARAAKELR